MSRPPRTEYAPDFVPLPGETLLEVLESRGMNQSDLALRTGRPPKTINEIIMGKTAITPETALQLERVLGIPASFWANLERRYREHRVRREERDALQATVRWASLFPVQRMMRYGWIQATRDHVERVQHLLDFFGIASPDQFNEVAGRTAPAFRISRSFEIDKYALAAWLRKGILEGQEAECRPFDRSRFQRMLEHVPALTRKDVSEFEPELKARCAECGIALVFVRELPKIRASGATRWLSPNKALIQLCLRHRYADIFWFNFLHEAGHISLHGKRDVFLENTGMDDEKEAQADGFAADMLVPRSHLQGFIDSGKKSALAVQRFATEIGVHPGIVVGRLQYEGYIPHKNLNDLRVRLQWAE